MSAYLSDDGLYRYSLTRETGIMLGEGAVAFIMLNPSTADATKDDPTIRRCIRFARDWGFERLKVLNLYAFRATNPGELLDTDDPVGPENLCTIAKVIGGCELVVCAWGASAQPNPEQAGRVLELVSAPHCLELTFQGFPRHPLYVKADTEPQPFAHCPAFASWTNLRAERTGERFLASFPAAGGTDSSERGEA